MELRIFETAREASGACADYVHRVLAREESKKRNIGLSGGTSFLPVYDLLAKRASIDWSAIQIFFCDERCVPPHHAESNYGSIVKHLLQPAGVPDENVFRMQGENNPAVEALRYTSEMEKHVPLKDGTPCFDLLLLGIGEDGHTASLFPASDDALHTTMSAAATKHPLTQQGRVTLTGKTLLNASLLIFLVTGKHKANAFSTIANRKKDYTALPAGLILSKSANAICFADTAAFLL